jgi:hypothetical protein
MIVPDRTEPDDDWPRADPQEPVTALQSVSFIEQHLRRMITYFLLEKALNQDYDRQTGWL